MKKNIIKLLAILLIVILSITSSFFFTNNKVSAEQYQDITFGNYFGWNSDYCGGGIKGQYWGGYAYDIQWGDVNCDGVINDYDLDYVEHALKRDKYNGGFALGIVYDLADVAEPYGVITYQDYVELSAVAHGEKFRQDLPIYSRVGYHIQNYESAIMRLDGNSNAKVTSENIRIAVGIYTGTIECIGAPRVLAKFDGTGYGLYNAIEILNHAAGGIDMEGQEGVTLKYDGNGGLSSIEYTATTPSEPWFECQITNYYNNKLAIYY